MYDKNVDMADADEVLLKALAESVAIASGNVERSGDVEAAADVARPSARGDVSEWHKQGVDGLDHRRVGAWAEAVGGGPVSVEAQ